ncbi:FtsX-like permease family protein [Candidatus Kaiserbacteria bacterium]|nr:FtsX-like permease family protein [Candidatus Kaiserbacteria bacterium]
MFSLLNIRVGFYLALRQLRRTSRWTTSLTVFVMLLTFLNLVVVTGLLVGIIAGISNQFRIQQTGDVMITALDTKEYIENSPQILSFLQTLPQPRAISARYSAAGTAEANYFSRVDLSEKPNETGASVVGIDPLAEDRFSNLSGRVKEGAYLSPSDYDAVLLGPQFIDRYSFGRQPGLTPLKNVYPGTKIRLTINGSTREVVVKGILDVPANSPLAARIFMPAPELRQIMGRTDYAVNEIAILLAPGTDEVEFRDLLKRSGIADKAKVQTFEEGIPNGVAEVQNTFAMIGNAIGSIGLVVAAITIFIVIFINAITRRKFIGILKGIGISGGAIELSYVFQSLFYAAIGSVLGLAILYGFLVPYVSAHPIVLPISNAIIVAPVDGTLIRIGLIVLTTVIAGYLPSRMIVRKNTLDSILGRN